MFSPDQWNVIETSLSRKEIAAVNSDPLYYKLPPVAAVLFRATRRNGIHIGQNHRGWLRNNMRMLYDQCETAPTSYASRGSPHSVEDTAPYTAICMIADHLRHLGSLAA
jgi:hypothetical protein